jgi:hypothetical protein
VKPEIQIRAGVFGKEDDVLLIADPPDASRKLALEYVAKNCLEFWGVMIYHEPHTSIYCEDGVEARAGLVRAVPLFARVIYSAYKQAGKHLPKVVTETWQDLKDLKGTETWN